jgi:Uma2 family endonuclease
MSALSAREPPLSTRHRFDVDTYHRMAESGIFGPEERVELIEGEFIDMAPIGPFHAGLASVFIRRLGYATEGKAIPWVQNPIHLGPRSEPQPDFALLRFRPDSYKSRLPAAADVLLLVEIADTSLRYDREVKIPLYARHAIPEYWLVNLPDQVVEVHRDPDPAQGSYREVQALAEGRLAPLHFPDISLDIGELLR